MRIAPLLLLILALLVPTAAHASDLQVGGQLGASYQYYNNNFGTAGVASVHAGLEFSKTHRFGGQIAGFFRERVSGATEIGGLALMFIYRYRTGWLPLFEPYFEVGAGPAFVGGQGLDGVLAINGVFGIRLDMPVSVMINAGVWGWYVFRGFFALTPSIAVGVEF